MDKYSFLLHLTFLFPFFNALALTVPIVGSKLDKQ